VSERLPYNEKSGYYETRGDGTDLIIGLCGHDMSGYVESRHSVLTIVALTNQGERIISMFHKM
jgi:hypothetical protein